VARALIWTQRGRRRSGDLDMAGTAASTRGGEMAIWARRGRRRGGGCRAVGLCACLRGGECGGADEETKKERGVAAVSNGSR
jgi:hypothetical protein